MAVLLYSKTVNFCLQYNSCHVYVVNKLIRAEGLHGFELHSKKKLKWTQ